METEMDFQLTCFCLSLSIHWSVCQDVGVKGKRVGEKDKWYDKEVKSMSYMTWTSYSAFSIYHGHLWKMENKTLTEFLLLPPCFGLHMFEGGIRDSMTSPSILFLEEELLTLLINNQNTYGAMRIVTFESDKLVTRFCPGSSAYDSNDKTY